MGDEREREDKRRRITFIHDLAFVVTLNFTWQDSKSQSEIKEKRGMDENLLKNKSYLGMENRKPRKPTDFSLNSEQSKFPR